jgi:zinc protease
MNRFPYYALLLAAPLLFFPGVSRAQSPSATSFKAVPLFTPSQIALKTLPNGVRGLVKSAAGSDLVNVQVWVKGGSRVESEKENGSSHLIELLALRGSKNYPAASGGEDDAGALGALRALGGDGGSLTSRDSTFYSATVAAPYADQAVKILADAVLRPDMAPAAVEEAKLQAADDIARRGFDPVSLASDLAYASAFSKHPYRRPTYGTDGSVGAITPKSLRAFYDKNYLGANISVIIVGQIATSEAQSLIAQNFGAASAKKPVALAIPKVPAEPLKSDMVARRRMVSREVIDLAWRSPSIQDPADCVAMDILLSLWREGLDANLRRLLLRDGENGPLTPLVASYDVDFLTQRDAGLFIVSLVDAVDREAAVNVVLDEIKRVRDKGVTPEELDRAKGQLREQYIEQGENAAGQAGALGFYEAIATHRFAINYLDLCARVTNADLKRVATKYLVPDKFIRSEIMPMPRPRQEQPNDSGPVITAKFDSHQSKVHQSEAHQSEARFETAKVTG